MKKALLIALLCLAGCETPFFRSIQGTSSTIGISLPNEDIVQFQAFQYLNGEKVVVRDVANISYSFRTSETNNYFGVIETNTTRDSTLEIKQ